MFYSKLKSEVKGLRELVQAQKQELFSVEPRLEKLRERLLEEVTKHDEAIAKLRNSAKHNEDQLAILQKKVKDCNARYAFVRKTIIELLEA